MGPKEWTETDPIERPGPAWCRPVRRRRIVVVLTAESTRSESELVEHFRPVQNERRHNDNLSACICHHRQMSRAPHFSYTGALANGLADGGGSASLQTILREQSFVAGWRLGRQLLGSVGGENVRQLCVGQKSAEEGFTRAGMTTERPKRSGHLFNRRADRLTRN